MFSRPATLEYFTELTDFILVKITAAIGVNLVKELVDGFISIVNFLFSWQKG